MQNRQTGFTLIELMIALAIIGILAGIAVPQYSKYMTEARRTDAHIDLRAAAQQIERCRTTKFSYAHADCAFTTRDSKEGHYTIELVSGTSATAFTFKATVKTGGAQVGDTDCNSMTINEKGITKSAKADATETSDCW